MGIRVVVGAIKYKNSKDPGDRAIAAAEEGVYTVKSLSAADFFKGLQKAVLDCQKEKRIKKIDREELAEELQLPEAEREVLEELEEAADEEVSDACCIEQLTVDGHASAGLGGEQGFDKLTKSQKADLQDWLCPNATIIIEGCFAFDFTRAEVPVYAYHLELALLLSKKGGTYRGFKGETAGRHPETFPVDQEEGQGREDMTKVSIRKGATRKEVEDLFRKTYPQR